MVASGIFDKIIVLDILNVFLPTTNFEEKIIWGLYRW